jgi:AcrR family transcriptional regulator
VTATADTTAARDAILDAAEQLFARQGFAATTIKQIGVAANVNSALLYYYFADKEALYREVLARLIGGLAAEGLHRVQGVHDPRQAIRALVEGQVEMLLARPHLPQLMARELTDHQAVHAHGAITERLAGLFDAVCEIVRSGQRAGIFRGDLEPRHAAISTIAQVAYFFLARPAIELLLDEGAPLPDDTVRAFGRHAAGFALAALAAHAPAEGNAA